MDQEQIYRYVMANDGFKDLGWYIDDSDSIDIGDQFIVDYRYKETLVYAKTVIRSTGPYAPYPLIKQNQLLRSLNVTKLSMSFVVAKFMDSMNI